MEQTKPNVVLYTRVSTDEQAQQGFSLKYQEETLLRYCKTLEYNVLKLFKEDHSAKNFNRPEWNKLNAYIKVNKRQVNKVLFLKWDRFSRNVEQAYRVIGEFDKMAVELNAVEQMLDHSNPSSKLFLSIYLSMGEVERLNISDRTTYGTYQAKLEGYYPHRAPYGYDNFRDGQKSKRKEGKGKRSTLVPNKDSFFVTQAFNEVAMNLEPIETIRRRFNEAGMKLGKSMFNDMLKNVVYAGKIIVPEYKKELATIVDGIHQPLIDMETFIRVQEIIRGKRWHGLKRSHDNIVFPLRGFLTCEVCGGQITGSISKGRSKKYGYYHCRKKCKTRVSVEDTHLKVSGLLKDLQINQNIKELFVEVLIDSENTISGNRKALLKTKLDRQQILKNNMEKADELLLKGVISVDSYNGMVNRINTELMDISMKVEELNTSDDSIKEYVENGLELLTSLEKWFLESDYDDKRILVGSLFNQKLILGNDSCRTTTINEVLIVLTRNSKGFGGIKKEKAVISDSFSASVPGVGIEPTFS